MCLNTQVYYYTFLLKIIIYFGRFDPIPSNYSEDLQRIIELMLSVEHLCRPTIEMILHHPTVVLNISTKSSFKFSNKKDYFKAECDKATLSLVSEKMKTLSVTEKDPEEITEDIFHEKWMVRLESLRQREANVRKKEDHLLEKERSMKKREKHLSLIERLTKEKLARAEVYLRQCRENKISMIARPQRYKVIEELDTSFSADPGDTSILPTSARIDPAVIPPPSNFVRAGAERRHQKHVHFDASKKIHPLPNIPEATMLPKSVQNEAKEANASRMKAASRKVLGEIQEIETSRSVVAKSMKVPLAGDSQLTSVRSSTLSHLNWEEEKYIWLEHKRTAYHNGVSKENLEQQKNELKELKKRSSKLSLSSKKQSFR